MIVRMTWKLSPLSNCSAGANGGSVSKICLSEPGRNLSKSRVAAPCRSGLSASEIPSSGSACSDLREQAIKLPFDHRVTLAGEGLQSRSVEYGDAATHVANQAGPLQFPSGLRDALAAHSQHIGNQFLGHGQLVGG